MTGVDEDQSRVRAKVRLGHVNARLRRRRSISPTVRTSAEKDPSRTRERTSVRANYGRPGVVAYPLYIPLNISRCTFDRWWSSTRRWRIRTIVFWKRMRCVRSRGVKWTFFTFCRPPRRRGVPAEWKTIRLYRIFHSLERAVVRLCNSGYWGRLWASRTATSFVDDSFAASFHLNERYGFAWQLEATHDYTDFVLCQSFCAFWRIIYDWATYWSKLRYSALILSQLKGG